MLAEPIRRRFDITQPQCEHQTQYHIRYYTIANAKREKSQEPPPLKDSHIYPFNNVISCILAPYYIYHISKSPHSSPFWMIMVGYTLYNHKAELQQRRNNEI